MALRTGDSPHAPVVGDSDALRRDRSRRLRIWSLVACLVVLGGATGAVLAARSVAASNAARSREAFAQSSSEVASTLQLAIEREQDLVFTAAGFFLGDPGATNAQFRAWSTSVQALARFPELIGWSEVLRVPASQLDAYAAKFVTRSSAGSASTGSGSASSGSGSASNGSFHPIPSGVRPYYCLAGAGQARIPEAVAPLDYCAGATGAQLLASLDSGQGEYGAVNLGHGQILAVDVPFYRGGATPNTVAARRAAFAGWMAMSFEPSVVLGVALRGHPKTAVQFSYFSPSSSAVFRAGKAPAGAQTVTTGVGNGWTVRTFGPAASAGVFGSGSALELLGAGIALSLTIGVLVFVLGTGRALALELVNERTGELRYQALHDALTGLPNRTLTLDRIDQLLARSRRAGTAGAALYVDVDEFKNVNDTLGHATGDRLLVAVAARLTNTLRGADTVGRMSGDEFVVLIDGAVLIDGGDVNAGAVLVAERLLAVIRQPFELGGSESPLFVNVSIGIALGDRADAGELLRDADIALYQAKLAGKNRYAIFDSDLQASTSDRIELEFDLRSALEDDEFRLVYQPIYRLDDLTLVGVEALLRWQHPVHGIIEPGRFVPILERTGQIREVGHWVLLRACEQMAAWHARGDTLDVSVNVSGVQLDGDAIVDHIREAIDSSGLAPGSLIVEVTETSLMRNADATVLRLEAIKRLGVKIAVDDFGTGYSSLAYLQRFPVDCLKIDRMFTKVIATSPESRALIGTLVQLGKDLGLTTLAEGVETPGQLDQLRGAHVNEIQGFLLSRPLDPEALEAQLLAPTRPAART
jgi:diguanylate cyclase (GGDEF)-like protein